MLEETKLFYKFARHVGIDNVIPVINYSDAAEVEESADLIKMELSEAFDEEGDTKSIENVVVGNFADPKENEIKNLVSAIDLIEVPSRKDGEPLLWPLENVGSIPNRGTFIAGRILAGRSGTCDAASDRQAKGDPHQHEQEQECIGLHKRLHSSEY